MRGASAPACSWLAGSRPGGRDACRCTPRDPGSRPSVDAATTLPRWRPMRACPRDRTGSARTLSTSYGHSARRRTRARTTSTYASRGAFSAALAMRRSTTVAAKVSAAAVAVAAAEVACRRWGCGRSPDEKTGEKENAFTAFTISLGLARRVKAVKPASMLCFTAWTRGTISLPYTARRTHRLYESARRPSLIFATPLRRDAKAERVHQAEARRHGRRL